MNTMGRALLLVALLCGCARVDRGADEPTPPRRADEPTRVAGPPSKVIGVKDCNVASDLDGQALAKALVQRGQEAYAADDLGMAAGCMLAVRELSPIPELDFNLGQIFLKMNDKPRAKRHFELFVAARPNSAQAARARQLIDELDQ